jgi:hypothetical protein
MSFSFIGCCTVLFPFQTECRVSRVARWYIFKPKIPVWVNFRGSCNGRCWYILLRLGPFYGHLIHFTTICYILWQSGIFFPRFGKSHQEKSGNPASQRLFWLLLKSARSRALQAQAIISGQSCSNRLRSKSRLLFELYCQPLR